MGTRHLTMIKLDGKLRLAQYGQWDGYPTGQGSTIADFIQVNLMTKKGIAAFKKQVKALRWADDAEVKDCWVKCGANPDSDFVGMDVSGKFGALYPHFSRDTGAKILDLINAGKVPSVKNDYPFLKDGLFCEYAYCLNLDTCTVNVYAGGPRPIKRIKFADFTKLAMKVLEAWLNEENAA